MGDRNHGEWLDDLGWYRGRDEIDFDRVTDRIYTGGGIWSARDVDRLVAIGVTHVVCAAEELEELSVRLAGDRLAVLPNGTDDDGLPKSPSWFGRIVRFALDALRDPDAKVYLHCAAGINRGPSAAYVVLRALGHSPEEAFGLIKTARSQAGIIYADSADDAIEALGMVGRGRSTPAACA
jgi:predicted protein tyrosine phosphatase